MLDIGFWELLVIAVLGVLIVGPEQLPGVVRHAILTVRRWRRMFAEVRGDIERELDLDDMRRFVEENEVRKSLRAFTDSVDEMNRDLRAGAAGMAEELSDPGIDRAFADAPLASREPYSEPPAARPGGRRSVDEDEDGGADAPPGDGETYRDTGIDPPRGGAAHEDA